ncbi:MAG: hypothetical protein AAFQ92_20915 [Bacteroidota bacterium]
MCAFHPNEPCSFLDHRLVLTDRDIGPVIVKRDAHTQLDHGLFQNRLQAM